MMMMMQQAVFVLTLACAALGMPKDEDVFTSEELHRYFGVKDHDKAPEYEIVYPQLVENDSKRSVGTGALAASSLLLEVDAFGETLALSVRHDDSKFAPGLQAEYVDDEGARVTAPVRTDCVYTGKVVGEEDSLVSITTCDGLMAVIFRSQGALYIEPLDDQHAAKRDMGRGFPHVAYKDEPTERGSFCQAEELPISTRFGEPTIQPIKDSASGVDTKTTKNIELAFIVDADAAAQRGTKTTTCVTALFNAIANLLGLDSLGGESLVPKLVHIKILGPEDGVTSSTDGLTYLRACGTWQYANNFASSDDRHWDNAVFLTGVDIKQSGNSGLLGIAYIGRCGKYGTSLSEFRSLSATPVTVHEIGHNLGMYHDGSGPAAGPVNSCSTTGYLMSTHQQDPRNDLIWSTCSKAYYDARKLATSCYND